MMLGFVLCKDGTEGGVAAQLRTEKEVEKVCRTKDHMTRLLN